MLPSTMARPPLRSFTLAPVRRATSFEKSGSWPTRRTSPRPAARAAGVEGAAAQLLADLRLELERLAGQPGGVGRAHLRAGQAGVGLGRERRQRSPGRLGLALALERQPPRRVVADAFLGVAVSEQVDHAPDATKSGPPGALPMLGSLTLRRSAAAVTRRLPGPALLRARRWPAGTRPQPPSPGSGSCRARSTPVSMPGSTTSTASKRRRASCGGCTQQGRHVVCYLDVGSWESYRPDADSFPRSVIGRVYEGFPDERWLDVRRFHLFAKPLERRFDICARKGFDAVEPDNIAGWENKTGFPIGAGAQLRFNRWVARQVHARGMAVALKNDGGQVGAAARRASTSRSSSSASSTTNAAPTSRSSRPARRSSRPSTNSNRPPIATPRRASASARSASHTTSSRFPGGRVPERPAAASAPARRRRMPAGRGGRRRSKGRRGRRAGARSAGRAAPCSARGSSP